MILGRAGQMGAPWWRALVPNRLGSVLEPVHHQLESVPTPQAPPPLSSSVRDRRRRPLAYYDEATHARRLVAMIYEESIAPAEILVAELQEMYAELMAELQWAERPWVMVSRHVRMQLGGRKTYAWVRNARGIQKRLRVYRFDAASCPAVAIASESPRLASAA